MNKIVLTILILLILLTTTITTQAKTIEPGLANAGSAGLPVLLGSYTSSNLQTTYSELIAMNSWLASNGASGVTFAGDFLSITLNPQWNVPHELDAAWNNGFVPFANLSPSSSGEGTYFNPNCQTAAQIAAGLCDDSIKLFATHFKTWAGTDKFAYIALLPEMNEAWVSYHSDGPTFIAAFKRIQSLFKDVGVSDYSVEWVFAPNGYNDPAYPYRAFENYYPGDLYVDVVAFSQYNFGGCSANESWRIWDTYETAYKSPLDRMIAMAPSKPIFLSQIGTVGVPDNPANTNENKSDWILDTFGKLADYPGVRGLIYFNVAKAEGLPNCAVSDYRFFYGNNSGEAGLITIMKDPRFGRWSTRDSNWVNVAFNDPAYTFADVQPTHPFSGASNVWYYDFVHKLFNNGITGGCQTTPDLLYCPNDSVTRGQMAVFLERGIHTSAFTPPDVSATFNDTVGHWAEDWIEALKSDGVTSGCGNGNFCPNDSVTRAQMAVFLLKAKYGAGYTPPNIGNDSGFTDVATDHWAAAWIKQLAAEGITSGCGGSSYCPESPVTRAQMAVFLVRTFSLP